jgi:hypothetical protein
MSHHAMFDEFFGVEARNLAHLFFGVEACNLAHFDIKATGLTTN